MFRATVTQFTSLQFVKNDLCILILLHLRFTWFMVDSFGTFRALLDYYFFLIIRFIYQNFVLDRFARCKRHELLSSRCSSSVVVNNHVATNSSLLNSFFTSTSSIMLWITSSVTDEYLSIVRFVIRFICNGFNSDYSIYDNSSCNFDSLSHRTFHLAVIKYNECIFLYLCDIISIDPYCNNINRRIISILPR